MRILRFVGWYLAFSAIAALGVLIAGFPDRPHSLRDWGMLLLLALPITLLGEALGALFFTRGSKRSDLSARGDSRFSVARIAIGVVAAAVLCMVLILLAIWMQQR